MPSRNQSRLRLRAAAVVVAVASTACGFVAVARAAKDNAKQDAIDAVRAVLDRQVSDWNRKDLDGFLKGYWQSPEVVFQSGGTKHVGFEAMRERYNRNYKAEGRDMGKLAFVDLNIVPLSDDSAYARGGYVLIMPDETSPSGLFTLILRKFPDGWKIIHDHTSAAPAE